MGNNSQNIFPIDQLTGKQPPLTARELEVLTLLCNGYSGAEIASMLTISVRSMDHYRNQITMKLSIRDLAGLTKYSIKAGIVSIYTHRADQLAGIFKPI